MWPLARTNITNSLADRSERKNTTWDIDLRSSLRYFRWILLKYIRHISDIFTLHSSTSQLRYANVILLFFHLSSVHDDVSYICEGSETSFTHTICILTHKSNYPYSSILKYLIERRNDKEIKSTNAGRRFFMCVRAVTTYPPLFHYKVASPFQISLATM